MQESTPNIFSSTSATQPQLHHETSSQPIKIPPYSLVPTTLGQFSFYFKVSASPSLPSHRGLVTTLITMNPTRGYSQTLTSDYSTHLSGLKAYSWDLSPRQSTLSRQTTTKSSITDTRSWTGSATVLPQLFDSLLTWLLTYAVPSNQALIICRQRIYLCCVENLCGGGATECLRTNLPTRTSIYPNTLLAR